MSKSSISNANGATTTPNGAIPPSKSNPIVQHQPNGTNSHENGAVSANASSSIHNPAPFPSRLVKNTKNEFDPDLLATFSKVEINIPLLEAIQQIPKYAKFLKQICTNKRKLHGKVSVGENISSIIQRQLPPKCKDPGMFSISCSLGDGVIDQAMIDLGAALSVMPYSTYLSLNLGPLSHTDVVLQWADRSLITPEGVLEDVLIQVQHLIFPIDVYIVKMEEDNSSTSCPLLLGRPFLKTAHTKIDVFAGLLTMECDGVVIYFQISSKSNPDERNQHNNAVDAISSSLISSGHFDAVSTRTIIQANSATFQDEGCFPSSTCQAPP